MPRERKNPDYKPPVRPEDRIVDVSDIPQERPDSTELQTVIDTAKQLIEERQETQTRIQECRLLGGMMTNNSIGSRAQVEWIRKYLPKRTRSGEEGNDDIETTEVTAEEVQTA